MMHILLTGMRISAYNVHIMRTISKNKSELAGKRSRTVRKTITLDGDLAQDITSFMIERGSSEKVVINDLIRSGIIHERTQSRKQKEFALPSFPKGIGEISRKELNVLLDEI